MRIAAISEALDRPSLEEIKAQADRKQEEEIHAVGGLIWDPTPYFDEPWAKALADKKKLTYR